jgi:4-hydroxy-3-polyprenylbenzoate decarboxylase
MGIDATKKWPSEGHTREWPEDIEMAKNIKDLVTRRWKEYDIE